MASFMQVEEKAKALSEGEKIREEVRKARAQMRKAMALPLAETLTATETLEKVGAVVAEHDGTRRPKDLRRLTRAILAENLPEYARMHLLAARKAAEKGDAKPAEFALQSVKPGGESAAVEGPLKDGGGSGVKILIGVNIGGLGTVGVVSASNEEKANARVQAEVGGLPDPRVVEGTVVGRPDPAPLP